MNGLGPLCAFLASCTWALGSSYYSKFSQIHRPFDVNLTRALTALPLFIIAGFITAGGFQGTATNYQAVTSQNFIWLTVSVISSYALGDVLFLLSTLSLGVPGALAIASAYPVLTALLGAFLENDPLRFGQWVGLSLAVGGIILVLLNDPKKVTVVPNEKLSTPSFIRKKWVGVILALVTMMAWAMNGYSVIKGSEGITTAVSGTIRLAYACLFISLLSPLTTKVVARPLPKAVFVKYAWVFILEAFCGSYFYIYGLTHSPLVLGNTLAALAPVISVPVSVILKLERFSLIRTFAVVTVVVGLSLLFR